jgi:hypothetical protein
MDLRRGVGVCHVRLVDVEAGRPRCVLCITIMGRRSDCNRRTWIRLGAGDRRGAFGTGGFFQSDPISCGARVSSIERSLVKRAVYQRVIGSVVAFTARGAERTWWGVVGGDWSRIPLERGVLTTRGLRGFGFASSSCCRSGSEWDEAAGGDAFEQRELSMPDWRSSEVQPIAVGSKGRFILGGRGGYVRGAHRGCVKDGGVRLRAGAASKQRSSEFRRGEARDLRCFLLSEEMAVARLDGCCHRTSAGGETVLCARLSRMARSCESIRAMRGAMLDANAARVRAVR